MRHLAAPAAWALAGLGTAACWAASEAGLWWATFAVGVALGLLLRGRAALSAAAAAGALGWGLPLAWLQVSLGLGPTAGALGAILGFGRLGGVVPTLFTLLVGVLLALTGAWSGVALRRLRPGPPPVRPED